MVVVAVHVDLDLSTCRSSLDLYNIHVDVRSRHVKEP